MNNITGHTGLTALLGSPVAHSISPLMHNESFRLLGLDYVYLCFDVNEETLPAAVAGLKTCGIRGFNLTMPNKNKIVELLDELSPEAQLIGAVNTVLNDWRLQYCSCVRGWKADRIQYRRVRFYAICT